MKKHILFISLAAGLLALASSCSPKVEITSENPSALITDKAKYEMIHSLETIDEDRFLVMNYTIDYKLDSLLEANVSNPAEMFQWVAANLMDVIPEGGNIPGMGAGCSAFAAADPATGDFLMGRNYDYCHVKDSAEVPLTAILVKTAPKGGKKSISMIDSYWIGYPKGFYKDGKTDLSPLMSAPYAILDGINEDGLAMGILHLGGASAKQNDPDKKFLWCNLVMRAALDKTSTVEEALQLVSQYNVATVSPGKGNYHFFMADATGDYAILEYSYKNGEVTEESVPTEMVVLKGQDHSYVTNFYVDSLMADNEKIGGKSSRGMARYHILKDSLTVNAYKLTPEQGMQLLKAASSSPKPDDRTSHTQWSALYNLSKKTMDISILQEYEKKYTFKVE